MAQNYVMTYFQKWVDCFHVWWSTLQPSTHINSTVGNKCEASISVIYSVLKEFAGEDCGIKTLESLDGMHKIEDVLEDSNPRMNIDCCKPHYRNMINPSNEQSNVIISGDTNRESQIIHVKDSHEVGDTHQKRGKYKKYTIIEKKTAVCRLNQGGITLADLSRQLGIPTKNIRRWKESGINRKNGDVGRRLRDPGMERVLQKWLLEEWQRGNEVSHKNIKLNALKLSLHDDFKASKGWLHKFIERCRRIQGLTINLVKDEAII